MFLARSRGHEGANVELPVRSATAAISNGSRADSGVAAECFHTACIGTPRPSFTKTSIWYVLPLVRLFSVIDA